MQGASDAHLKFGRAGNRGWNVDWDCYEHRIFGRGSARECEHVISPRTWKFPSGESQTSQWLSENVCLRTEFHYQKFVDRWHNYCHQLRINWLCCTFYRVLLYSPYTRNLMISLRLLSALTLNWKHQHGRSYNASKTKSVWMHSNHSFLEVCASKVISSPEYNDHSVLVWLHTQLCHAFHFILDHKHASQADFVSLTGIYFRSRFWCSQGSSLRCVIISFDWDCFNGIR